MQAPRTNQDVSTTPTVCSTVHDQVDIPGSVENDADRPLSHIVSTHEEQQPLDIEHVFVQDDPRQWSKKRKVRYLVHVSLSYFPSL